MASALVQITIILVLGAITLTLAPIVLFVGVSAITILLSAVMMIGIFIFEVISKIASKIKERKNKQKEC